MNFMEMISKYFEDINFMISTLQYHEILRQRNFEASCMRVRTYVCSSM